MSAYKEKKYFDDIFKPKVIQEWDGHLAERDPVKIENFNKKMLKSYDNYKKSPSELECIRNKQLNNVN